MNRFIVAVTVTEVFIYDIEAESKDQARGLADEMEMQGTEPDRYGDMFRESEVISTGGADE